MLRIAAALIALVLALSTVGPLFAEEGGSYVVHDGDTLSAIAQRFNTTIRALTQANGIEDPDLIYAGQTLALPGDAVVGTAAPNSAPAAAPSAPAPAPARRTVGSATSILSQKRLITYYGNPWAAQMGILGELSTDQLVSELRRVAKIYQSISDKPVQPAIQLIATVAQAGPGADGLYRLRMPDSMIQQYIDLADQNGMPIILDIQVGRSTVRDEVAAIQKYLVLPNVYLALDPEFDMWGSEVPGVQLGHMTADEINEASQVLSGIVSANGLPNKILIVHQFTEGMITGKSAIQTPSNVDIVIDMDGFGGQAAKISRYNAYVRDEPVQFAGIKLFYRHDVDLITPKQALSLTPPPDVIIYQ